MKHSLIAAAALALVTAGCGSSDDEPRAANSEPSATTAGYTAQVNELCTALIDEVVPVTGDSAPVPSRSVYLAQAAELAPVYDRFDAAVDAVEVSTDEDREARNAFTGYLAALAAVDADMQAKADTLADPAWSEEYEKALDALFVSPERQRMVAAGITCPAR